MGYEKESKNYRLFDPATKTIRVSRKIVFNEKITSPRNSQPPSTFLFSIDKDDLGTKDLEDEMLDNIQNHPN